MGRRSCLCADVVPESDSEFDYVAFGVGDDAFVEAFAVGAWVAQNGYALDAHAFGEVVDGFFAAYRYGDVAESAEFTSGFNSHDIGLVHYLKQDSGGGEGEEIRGQSSSGGVVLWCCRGTEPAAVEIFEQLDVVRPDSYVIDAHLPLL